MMNEEMTLAIKQGVYWLNENYPNWEQSIDMLRLDLSACDACVLGQVAGDYTDIVKSDSSHGDPPKDSQWATDHGFEQNGDDPDCTYSGLTEGWKDYLRGLL